MTPDLARPVRYTLAILLTLAISACGSVTPRPPTMENSNEAAPAQVAPTATQTTPLPAAPVEGSNEIRISAVGDIMLDGTARPVLQENGYDYPFVNIRPLFRGSQVVIGNLEGPLTTRGEMEQDKTYTFRSPPDKVSKALVNAGFNVVTLANNHTLDFGAQGLADTIDALDGAGILHVGAGADLASARRAAIMTVNGQRIAFLGYSVTLPETFYAARDKAGTAFAHEAHVRADVAAARSQADIVIVSFHWGQEGKTELRDYQVRLGRAAIDAGAQAVLGHHPHILQAIEHYRDGIILYSLGNFTFGSYSMKSAYSAVAQITFRHGRLSGVQMVPIKVNNFEVQFQPRVLAGAEANSVIDTLQRLSEMQHTTVVNTNGVARVQLPQATARAE
jgi:poly-gamma-glutamate synthesis protein (capsule biosynthesis protein)